MLINFAKNAVCTPSIRQYAVALQWKEEDIPFYVSSLKQMCAESLGNQLVFLSKHLFLTCRPLFDPLYYFCFSVCLSQKRYLMQPAWKAHFTSSRISTLIGWALNCDSSLPPSALLNTYVHQFFVVLSSSSLSLERLYTYTTERGPNTETEDEHGIIKNAPCLGVNLLNPCSCLGLFFNCSLPCLANYATMYSLPAAYSYVFFLVDVDLRTMGEVHTLFIKLFRRQEKNRSRYLYPLY